MVAALHPHRPGAGEVSSIALIHDLDIAKQPRSGTAVLLSELPGKLPGYGIYTMGRCPGIIWKTATLPMSWSR